MPNELDDFLSQQKERLAKKDEKEAQAERESAGKRNIFEPKFQELMRDVIHPAMVNILDKLRRHSNYSAKVLHEPKAHQKPPSFYPNERYEIHPGSGKYFILSVEGNYDLQKVCVDTEYFESFRENGESKARTLKKTEEKYELSETTHALLEAVVVKGIKEIMPSTEELRENS
ncbi:MAG: hypothetical protein HY841_04105 [Bacteroidetes bacterium]|nr:hypothetical protein [Bacteroidota bacterium]